MFTPDDPSDTSNTSRGTLRVDSIEYRCVRLKAKGLPHSYGDWSRERGENDFDYQVSEDDQVRFLAVHTAFEEVIQKHGPEIFLVDVAEKVVFFEEVEGKNLRKFMYDTDWTSSEEVEVSKQVMRNTVYLMSSVREDGFCAPTYASGYVVQPDFTVVQVDFEEIVNTQHNNMDCDDKISLQESLRDILRSALSEDDDDYYDKVEELLHDSGL